MSDVFHFIRRQAVNEQKTYSPDYDQVLPSGASIASASATWQQTLLGTASGSVAVTIASGGRSLAFRTPAHTAGVYRYTVSATVTDSQVRIAIYDIRVES